jgi:hypothetical protein
VASPPPAKARPKASRAKAQPATPTAAPKDLFQEALSQGRALVEQERAESPQDIAEKADLDRSKVLADLEKAQIANDNERALIGLRKSYGRNMVRFLWIYFIVAIGAVLASGAGWLHLPDSVAVALVGGTAVSVLGVVGTIVAGLFRVKG